MTDRFWICIYNHPTEGLHGVVGEGTGACTDDVPLLLSCEDLIAEVFNPDLSSGMWIISGTVEVIPRHGEDPVLDYDGDPNSPAPDWRRLTEAELRAIANGETPREMARWLAGEAWAE